MLKNLKKSFGVSQYKVISVSGGGNNALIQPDDFQRCSRVWNLFPCNCDARTLLLSAPNRRIQIEKAICEGRCQSYSQWKSLWPGVQRIGAGSLRIADMFLYLSKVWAAVQVPALPYIVCQKLAALTIGRFAKPYFLKANVLPWRGKRYGLIWKIELMLWSPIPNDCLLRR